MPAPKHILPTIVFAQFCCTSLWFAGNGVMPDLINAFSLPAGAVGSLTSSVQFGFIAGTLLFALLSVADRFSPAKVFCVCALLGALSNWSVVWEANTYLSLLGLRVMTGFFLAGIYPVGMKIAADYFNQDLGKSLGFLVGALVLGTALPHLLSGLKLGLPWAAVLVTTSGLAVGGGLLMLVLVPDGPYRKPSQRVDLLAIPQVFQNQKFKAAALGYFGHMWELYAFWAFVPLLLHRYVALHASSFVSDSLLTFCIISIGSLGCVGAGYLAQQFGIKRVAAGALGASGCCCLLVPVLFALQTPFLFECFLLFWGLVVVADSPLFSTLVAQNAPSELKGTALTIVNSIGFALTIVSIQLIGVLNAWVSTPAIFTVLAIGPFLGLMSFVRQSPKTSSKEGAG